MKALGIRCTAIGVLGCSLLLPLLQAKTPKVTGEVPTQGARAKHRTSTQHKPALPLTVDLSQIPLSKPLHWVEFTPSGPLTIHYRDGKLTIISLNNPLHDVLRGIGKQLGASVEFPPSANDHVFGQIGPGRASDVVASLLFGVNFNYVISVSAEDPNQLTRVVLSSKPPPLPADEKKRKP